MRQRLLLRLKLKFNNMKQVIQFFLIFTIIWSCTAGLFAVAIPLALGYIFYFRGFELIFVAILIDGYYQAFYSFPILSIGTIIAVFLIDFIKPQLLMYTGHNEMVS